MTVTVEQLIDELKKFEDPQAFVYIEDSSGMTWGVNQVVFCKVANSNFANTVTITSNFKEGY